MPKNYRRWVESEAVLDNIRNTPRHLFVDEALASRAYENTALPIGFSQTISQPYIVAKMIEALIKDRKLEKVLEVGTGCGYQTVILSQFVQQVYTVERINGLLMKARANVFTNSIYEIFARNMLPIVAISDGHNMHYLMELSLQQHLSAYQKH